MAAFQCACASRSPLETVPPPQEIRAAQGATCTGRYVSNRYQNRSPRMARRGDGLKKNVAMGSMCVKIATPNRATNMSPAAPAPAPTPAPVVVDDPLSRPALRAALLDLFDDPASGVYEGLVARLGKRGGVR